MKAATEYAFRMAETNQSAHNHDRRKHPKSSVEQYIFLSWPVYFAASQLGIVDVGPSVGVAPRASVNAMIG